MAFNAMTLSWRSLQQTHGLLFANPPFQMIPAVLQKMTAEKVDLLLLAPMWPSAPWWPMLQQLAVSEPRLLPQKQGVFLSATGKPLPPPKWGAAVWKLSAAILPHDDAELAPASRGPGQPY